MAPVAGVAGVAALAAVGAWRMRPSGSGGPPGPSSGTSAAQAVEVRAATPAAVGPPAEATVPARRFLLPVRAPAGANVFVDGARASLLDGGLELSGAIGSVFHVRIASGPQEAKADVVLSQGGPVPAEVELLARAPASHTAVRPAPSTSPGVPLVAAASPGPTPPPAPKAPQVPAAAAGTPAIDRSF